MTTRVIVLREILAAYGERAHELGTEELRDIVRDLDDIDPLRATVRSMRSLVEGPQSRPINRHVLIVRLKKDWPSLWRAIQQAIKEIK